jgi:hypothetical protein
MGRWWRDQSNNVESVTEQRNEKQRNEMKIAVWNAGFEIQES